MTDEEIKKIWSDLSAPFNQGDVKYRIQSMNQQGTQALMLPYADSRSIQERLDSVLGPENWNDEYQDWQPPTVQLDPTASTVVGAGAFQGKENQAAADFVENYYSRAVKCILRIRVNGEWISKEGIAQNTDIEPQKGGESQALRRAAVKWGIARYLYNLPDIWVPVSVNREGGSEYLYYKRSYYYYNKPDLEKLITGKSSSATEKIEKSQKSKSNSSGNYGNTSNTGNTDSGTVGPPEGVAAISTAELRDWQTRIAKLGKGNKNVTDKLTASNQDKDSMSRVADLLGACWILFADGSKERSDITSLMTNGNRSLPDMVTTLKNSLVALEG